MSDAPHPRPPHTRLHVLLAVAVAALVILADQLSKLAVLDVLGPHGDRTVIPIVPGLLRLIYVQNTGAAFGMFQGRSPVILVLAVAVIILLLYYFREAIAASRWLALALGLQIGGAIGNMIDRLNHGFVVDFINVPHWPTFNVADSAVTVGVIMLAIYLIGRDAPRAAEDTPSARPVQPEAQERP